MRLTRPTRLNFDHPSVARRLLEKNTSKKFIAFKMVFAELAILVATLLCTYFYLEYKKSLKYFEKIGIPFVKPTWPVGSDWRALTMRDHGAISQTRMYKSMEPHKVIGFYQGTHPFIMVRDPEYIQRIFTTDFSHFIDRFLLTDGRENSPLEGHLFALRGARWRYMRAKLSPIFTSGKLKWMYSEMTKCVDAFSNHLNKTLTFGEDVDMKEDCQGFTTEVISSCAFGMESNTIGNPNSEFRKFARSALQISPIQAIKNAARAFFPKIVGFLRLRSVPQDVEDFVMNLVKQSFDHRLKTGYIRNDFIQLLLQLREKGSVEFEEQENDEEDEYEKKHLSSTEHLESNKGVIELNDGVLGAQLFVFLVAGFETTASTMYHLVYLFSLNPDCQEKAREEVKKALAKHGGYTFDMMKALPYLSNCINETLRLFPPLPFHFRICTKDYTFPDGTRIEKGAKIIMPIYSIHRDPKYFPEPQKFKPERFEEDIVRGAYSPFGDGPRVCIGKRFAVVEIHLAIARFLMQFRILPSSEPKRDLVLEPVSFLLNIKGGVKVKIEKLQ